MKYVYVNGHSFNVEVIGDHVALTCDGHQITAIGEDLRAAMHSAGCALERDGGGE